MDARAAAWFSRRTARWQDFPVEWLLAGKQRRGLSVSVVIPARDEEHTVGGVVSAIRQALMAEVALVDELVVIDSDSADGTRCCLTPRTGTAWRQWRRCIWAGAGTGIRSPVTWP